MKFAQKNIPAFAGMFTLHADFTTHALQALTPMFKHDLRDPYHSGKEEKAKPILDELWRSYPPIYDVSMKNASVPKRSILIKNMPIEENWKQQYNVFNSEWQRFPVTRCVTSYVLGKLGVYDVGDWNSIAPNGYYSSYIGSPYSSNIPLAVHTDLWMAGIDTRTIGLLGFQGCKGVRTGVVLTKDVHDAMEVGAPDLLAELKKEQYYHYTEDGYGRSENYSVLQTFSHEGASVYDVTGRYSYNAASKKTLRAEKNGQAALEEFPRVVQKEIERGNVHKVEIGKGDLLVFDGARALHYRTSFPKSEYKEYTYEDRMVLRHGGSLPREKAPSTRHYMVGTKEALALSIGGYKVPGVM